jgi:hypothetical protein
MNHTFYTRCPVVRDKLIGRSVAETTTCRENQLERQDRPSIVDSVDLHLHRSHDKCQILTSRSDAPGGVHRSNASRRHVSQKTHARMRDQFSYDSYQRQKLHTINDIGSANAVQGASRAPVMRCLVKSQLQRRKVTQCASSVGCRCILYYLYWR